MKSLMSKICVLAGIIALFCLSAEAGKKKVKKQKIWPDVLVIDNFGSGLGKWENNDAGKLTISKDSADGSKQSMLWSAGDDGVGHIILKNLSKDKIDFSEYDMLVMDVKISGKRVWNINPIIQQYPAVYGFRGLYYSIDSMEAFDKWFTYSQDLSKWENAWPDSFSATKQEFQFEIYQLAGAEKTKIFFDNIRLIKNPLKVPRSVPGELIRLADGSQLNQYSITLKNTKDKDLTVSIKLAEGDKGTIDKFKLKFPKQAIKIKAGEEVTVPLSITAPGDVIKKSPQYYGEMARIAFNVKEIPGLTLFTELNAGTLPEKIEHPMILCDRKKMLSLQASYKKPATQKKMSKAMLRMVKTAEKALGYKAEYPKFAALGIKKDPVSGGVLKKIDVPNMPFNVYQDPISGRCYSGPMYDAGVLGWFSIHMKNASVAEQLSLGYLITGKKEFAEKSAEIIKKYIEIYPKLPLVAPAQGSPAGNVTSGTVRIGSTYMFERRWLSSLATAVDSIRASGVLSKGDLKQITEQIFIPSGENMMDHKVGVMNLQWQIDSAGILAGLAVDYPGLITRSLRDTHGIENLIKIGFLDDGQWWENPSYQGVAKLAAFPVIAVLTRNKILPWSDKLNKALKAAYKLHGPDGLSPTLGTGGYRNLSFENAGVMMMASQAKNDPELAWILYNKKVPGGIYNMYAFAVFGFEKPTIPREKTFSPIATKTVDFPDYGGIAMRLPDTDQYCYLHYGRTLVHGHCNKLSINAYGKGGWYARNTMGGYGHNFANFLETVASANTIMVDGKNADQDTGELLFQKSLDGIEMTSSREVGAWKDVEHERSIIMTKGPVIMIDRCLADKEHVYDWLYHAAETKLKFKSADLVEEYVKALGKTKLYESLKPEKKFKKCVAKFQELNWDRKNGSGLKMAMLSGGEKFLFKITDTFRPYNGILWRKKGKTVTFAMAFMPYAKGVKAQVAIEVIPVTDKNGKRVTVKDGQAYKVSSSEGTYTILVNYSGQLLNAGDLASKERVSVIKKF